MGYLISNTDERNLDVDLSRSRTLGDGDKHREIGVLRTKFLDASIECTEPLGLDDEIMYTSRNMKLDPFLNADSYVGGARNCGIFSFFCCGLLIMGDAGFAGTSSSS